MLIHTQAGQQCRMLVCGYYVPPKISIKFYNSPMWWANAVIISALWMDKLRVKSVQGQKNFWS